MYIMKYTKANNGEINTAGKTTDDEEEIQIRIHRKEEEENRSQATK